VEIDLRHCTSFLSVITKLKKMIELTTAFMAILYITAPSYAFSIPLFFWKRDKFPIAQRAPILVTIELIFVALNGLVVLWQGAVEDPNAFIKNCRNYSVLEAFVEDWSYLLLLVRVGWLFFKDFTTKLLVAERNSRKTNFKQKYKSRVYRILSAQVLKLGFRWSLMIYVFPVIIFVIFDYTETLKLAPAGVNTTDPACAGELERTVFIEAAILLYFGLLGAIAVYSLRKLKDNFNLFREFRFLAFPILAQFCIFLGEIVANQPLLHLIKAAIVTSSFVCIQTIYPIKLSYDHNHQKQAEANTKENNKTVTHSEIMSDLNHFLADPVLRTALQKFLESEFSVENLMFILTVDEIDKAIQSEKYPEDELLSMLTYLRDTFLLTAAPGAINVSGKVRTDAIICTTDENLEKGDRRILGDTLQRVRIEVFAMLAKDSFRRFRNTKEYLDVKSEVSSRKKVNNELTRSRSSLSDLFKETGLDCCTRTEEDESPLFRNKLQIKKRLLRDELEIGPSLRQGCRNNSFSKENTHQDGSKSRSNSRDNSVSLRELPSPTSDVPSRNIPNSP
jgi:hypothetical protein